MFAKKYLQKQNKTALITEVPLPEAGIAVVIPCFYEPEILKTLESLNQCEKPRQNTEIIVLINHSENAPQTIKDFNRQTKTKVDRWIAGHKNEKLTFYAVGPLELKKKWAGAGLARKWGMDEAVLRFDLLQKPDGIIVSLDADTLVEKNYFTEIENHFWFYPKNVGATIFFEHQKAGLLPKHLLGIELYEKYLGYYKKAVAFTGYPYSMFTVGSAFAVKAESYVRRGGMNRRQAGEDFYFLQNLVQLGPVGEITTTKVYPSARLSARVPFGTGPILQKWMNGQEDLTVTYNFQAFDDLKKLFDIKEKLFGAEKTEWKQIVSILPETVQRFLKADNFWGELEILNQNCSSVKTFQTRFYHVFNAFRILKYLNFVHEHFYQKADLHEQLNKIEKIKENSGLKES